MNLKKELDRLMGEGRSKQESIEILVCRAAREYLNEFDIPWNKYDEGRADGDEESNFEVTFRHRRTGAEIVVTEIWWDGEKSIIMQAGSSSGRLEF